MIKISHAVPASNIHNCSSSFDQFRRYCAEVSYDLLDQQGELLDWLIGIAFDTLDAHVLDLRVIISANDDISSVFAAIAITLPPHDPGPPSHRHAHHTEGCYVIDGTLALTQHEYTTILTSGAAALVLPDIPHTYWNPTAAPTTLLLMYHPGATEAELIALARGAPVAPDSP
jgi:quercetin dioxygenase-like cupin family protein